MKGCKSWLLAVSLCAPLAAQAAEPESCASVRFADVGWTDITVTTAVTRQVLESLGYKTKVNLLSVPVTYRSLANNDLDVFLGNWMPTMTNDIKQYAEKGTVETLRANLEGAKYTLAVPSTSTTAACAASPISRSSPTSWATRSTASSRATTATASPRA